MNRRSLIAAAVIFTIATALFADSATPESSAAAPRFEHPRLLFSAAEVAAWRAAGPAAQQFIWDAGRDYFASCAAPAPEGEPWNVGDGWQRWGWWRGTTTALLYAKTGRPDYADAAIDLLARMCASEHWELGGERDYGMGAANIMATVAILYDACYDRLDADQRQFVRRRLLTALERMHDYGFYEIRRLDDPAVRYWQSDPQNNHRWHRACGYLLAALAIDGEIEGVGPYLDDAVKQAEFILRWLPADGSCHESVGYQAFGTQFLVTVVAALDRCTGSKHLTTNRAFREFPHFRAHMVTPDRRHVWSYGDGGEGVYYFSHYNFKLADAWDDAFMQAAHLANFAAAPGSYGYHGFSLLWHNPDQPAADLAAYPTWRFFPDMGIATFRENWSDDGALAAFFKCGPYGGHRLNEYRDSRTPPIYVNVAHDHPDANSFLLSFGGELLAQDFGTHARLSSEHNTLTVNGRSQRGGGVGWTQPIDHMGDDAAVEAYFGAPGVGMVRGEAGGAYEDLSRYARTLVYTDDYLLVADDVRAPEPADLAWHYNTTAEVELDPAGTWRVSRGAAGATVAVLTPEGLSPAFELVEAERGRRSVVARVEKVRRATLATLIVPEAGRDVSLIEQRVEGLDVMAVIARGELRDVVIVSADRAAADYQGVRTDAAACVATLDEGRVARVMLAGGRYLHCGEFSISFSRPVNCLYDAAAETLELCCPLGGAPGKVRVTLEGGALRQVNGEIIGPGGAGSYLTTAPTWQQRQNTLDTF